MVIVIKYRSDGRKYKGFWSNGKQHGEGEFLHQKENQWRKGIWNEGKRIRWVGENAQEYS
jgi:hypothetical protein